jgi:pimeloyl-ACP methyl ester carboxylesterase
VVAYDMPGFGLSSKPSVFDYRNQHQAEIAAALIKALKLEKVVIGGHSLGGAIALRAALVAPETAGLVVMNPGIITTGVPAAAKYITLVWPMARIQAKLLGDPDFRGNFLRQSFVDPSIITPEVIADLGRTARTPDYLSGMTSMMGQYYDADEVKLLPAVKVPSLVAFGARDKGKPDPQGEMDTLHAGLKDSETLWVTTSGHYVHEEAPAEVAAAMAQLAQKLLGGPGIDPGA